MTINTKSYLKTHIYIRADSDQIRKDPHIFTHAWLLSEVYVSFARLFNRPD